MIIHSPIISGSLTFADGSTFTLPDGGNYSGSFSGSIQIAEVQSHLIPDTTEVYDLGSATHRFRDIYLSDATIKLGSGKFGITGGIFQMTTNDDVPMTLGVGSMQLKPVGFPPISLTSTATGFNLVDEDDEPAPMQIKSLTIKSASNSASDFSIGTNNGKISFTTYGSGTCATYRLQNHDLQENLFFSYTDCNGDPVTTSLNTSQTTTFQALEGSFARTSGTDNYTIKLTSYDTIESAPVEVSKLTITGSAGGGTIVSTDSGVKVTDPEDETQPGQVELATITLTNDSGVAGTKVTANAGTGQVSFTDLFDEPTGLIVEQITIPPASGSSNTTSTVIKQKTTAQGSGVSFFEVSSSQCARYRVINHSTQQNLFFNYTDCDGVPVTGGQILTSTSDVITMQMGSFQRTAGGSDHYDIKLLDYVNADYAVAEIKELEISTTGSSDNIVIRLDDNGGSGTPKLTLTVSGSDAPAELQTGNLLVSGSNGTSTITNDLPGEGLAVTDSTGSLTPIKVKTIEIVDSETGDVVELKVESGSLNTTATNSSGSAISPPQSNLTGSFTGSLGLTGDITSEADCVKIGTELNPICDIYATRITGSLSGTVNGINIVDVKTNVDAILSGSAADKDSFAEIVTLINSVDTTNDSVFAGFVTSSNAAQGVQDGRLTALEAETGSIATAQGVQDGRLDTLENTVSNLSTDYNDLENIPSGIVSSSIQVDITGTTNYSTVSNHIANTSNPHSVTKTQVGLSNVDNTSDADKPISTATQDALDLKATVSALNTEKDRIDAILASSDADKDSFAEIVTLINTVDTTNDNAFASFYTASNDRFDNIEGFTSSIDTTIKTKMDADSVVSGSSQVTLGDVSGFNTFSSSVSATFDGLSSNYVDLIGIPDGIISGSDQIAITSANISDVDAFSQSGTYANLRAQATTAGDVGLGNVTNESKTTMFTSPTFTGTVSNSGGAVVTDEITITSGGQVRGSLTGDADGLYLTAPSGKGIGILTDGANDGMIVQSDGSTVIYGSLALENIPANTSSEFAVVVGASNTLNYRQLGSNAFNSTAYATTASVSNVDNTSDADKPVSTAQQSALDLKVNKTSAQALSSAGDALTLSGDTLTLTRGDGSTDTVDLSAYLDEDARAIASGILNSSTGIVTFTRDDASTFTLDLSALLDDTNLVTSVAGKSGVVTLVKGDVGLGNVDNTSDANKPVSTATQTALDLKYDASNPVGYTTYTSNQATNTTSDVTFASVSATGDVVAYSSSDRRLKDNIVNIENPIEKVQKLNGVTWDWNDNADELQKSIANVGVIAQEVEEVLPQLVKDRENGYKGVDYAKLTGLLIEAVKEQQKQIDELKARLG